MTLHENEVKEIHKAVYELIQKGDLENSIGLINTLLEHNPNDAAALNFMGIIHLEQRTFSMAYQYFRRSLQEQPNRAPTWVNFGLSAHELGRNEEAMYSYVQSAKLDENYIKAYVNSAAIYIEEANWTEAEKVCELALAISPDNDMAKKNLAHVYLAQHKWKKGWEYWDLTLGCQFRKELVYGEEKRWDGKKGQCVVVYGEQGLGDEINYASVIPDAINDCKKIIIDCDPRLEKLFKRSFPKAMVYGTRRDNHPQWLADAKIDARCAISSLPKFYRNSDESFPGTPYLKADPEMVKMFKGYWEGKGKKVYGICTHGGSKLTGESWRKLVAEDFAPIFKADAIRSEERRVGKECY